MTNNKDLRYIIDLLEDSSDIVSQSVDKYLISQGEDILFDLAELYKKEDDSIRKELLSQKIHQLNQHFCLEQLKKYVELSKEGEASLLEGAFLISSLLTPGITRRHFYDICLPMIGEVMAETSEQKTGVENVKILNHIFYKRFQFKASDPFSLNDSDLLFLNVLQNRKGNPIAISIFYILIAQACGIPIYPMCFTGGFITVYAEGDKPLFYLNLFHEGEIFLENNLSTLLQGQQLPIDINNFEIKKDSTILLIYLELLDNLYSMSGNTEKQAITDLALQCFGSNRFMTIEEEE